MITGGDIYSIVCDVVGIEGYEPTPKQLQQIQQRVTNLQVKQR